MADDETSRSDQADSTESGRGLSQSQELAIRREYESRRRDYEAHSPETKGKPIITRLRIELASREHCTCYDPRRIVRSSDLRFESARAGLRGAGPGVAAILAE